MDAAPTLPPTRLTALARRLVRLVTDRARSELIGAGFSEVRPAHNVVLAQVAGSESGARITDMADRAGVTKQAVTLMVDHLEAGGYVVRSGAERLTELKTTLADLIAGLERDAAPGLDPPETGPGEGGGTG